MSGSKDIQECSGVIQSVMANLRKASATNSSIPNIWCEVLYSIDEKESSNFDGSNLASHTRVEDLRSGVLYISVDHPGWIQVLSLYKRHILRLLSKRAKGLNISKITALYERSPRIRPAREETPIKPLECIEPSDTKPTSVEHSSAGRAAFSALNTKDAGSSSIELPLSVRKMFSNMRKVILTK